MEEKMIEVRKISERELMVGENRIFMEDGNIQNIILVGNTDAAMAKVLVGALVDFAKTFEGKIHSLVDLNRAGKASPEMRKIGPEMIDADNTGKVALFGLHPVARVLASFVIGVTRKKDLRFFKTREEAVAWLKQ
jgi:hypothetical protein